MGIILISVVEVGVIFSGNIGTGIVMRKYPDGTWSPPSACGLTGIGFGFAVGASLKDLIVFVNEESTMETFSARASFKIGTQSELAIGPLGRSYQFDAHVSTQNFGPTVAIAFSQGAFLGFSTEGAVIGVRNNVNKAFYGKETTAREILYGQGVEVPKDKVTLLGGIYLLLNKLAEGVVSDQELTSAETKKAALIAAESATEHSKDDPEVITVDAAAEAAKESS